MTEPIDYSKLPRSYQEMKEENAKETDKMLFKIFTEFLDGLIIMSELYDGKLTTKDIKEFKEEFLMPLKGE